MTNFTDRKIHVFDRYYAFLKLHSQICNVVNSARAKYGYMSEVPSLVFQDVFSGIHGISLTDPGKVIVGPTGRTTEDLTNYVTHCAMSIAMDASRLLDDYDFVLEHYTPEGGIRPYLNRIIAENGKRIEDYDK
jgi:hypothetical protein